MSGKKFRSVGAKIALAFALMLPILLYQLGSNVFEAVSSYRNVVTIDRQNAAANNLIAGGFAPDPEDRAHQYQCCKRSR